MEIGAHWPNDGYQSDNMKYEHGECWGAFFCRIALFLGAAILMVAGGVLFLPVIYRLK